MIWSISLMHGEGKSSSRYPCKMADRRYPMQQWLKMISGLLLDIRNNNEMHGEFTVHYKNGDTYVGELKDGKKHGNGIYTWVDGKRYEGKWVNDKFSFTDGVMMLIKSMETALCNMQMAKL